MVYLHYEFLATSAHPICKASSVHTGRYRVMTSNDINNIYGEILEWNKILVFHVHQGPQLYSNRVQVLYNT